MEEKEQVLHLRLLGEPQLTYKGASLAEPLAQKEQALLIYLACRLDQRFSREILATLLWGESPQERARYNLRRALWNIRRTIDEIGLDPDECLVSEGSWVYVPPTAPCRVDVRAFETVLQACFHDPQSRFSPSSEGTRQIRQALDLYKGDFLAGFSVLHAPEFDEWLTLERERLFLLLLRALTSLIQDFIARGERKDAIDACLRLLVLDPLQEDIRRLLMRLYWETGQRAQALRQYNTYQELLQRELGIVPLEETQDLYQRILQHETPPVPTASSLVLTSRVTPPVPATESLYRTRLFSLLDRGLAVRITMLSAPPGYGKTTLVAQWLDHHSWNEVQEELFVAWYKVDEADNTPLNFVEGLTASVARLHPAMGQDLQDQIHDLMTLQRNPHQAGSLMVNMLASLDPTPFIIVLDDLERLTDQESQRVLQYVAEHLPPNGHLYLLTRVDPNLPLPRLRVRGQLLELRADELRFTEEEMRTFLGQSPTLHLSPADVDELTTRAEGWVAPLWLAASALSRFTTNLDDIWDGIFAYIRDEVVAPQPAGTRAFLLRSAIMDRLSPSLCQTVLETCGDEHISNPAKWLATLERRNLFLRRVAPPTAFAGGTGKDTEPLYAYHPLFLAFLRAELVYHLSSTEIEDLHRRVARAWEQQNNLEAALFHYRQTGDESGIARLLERIAPTYLQQGRLEPLAHWLDDLEPSARDQLPRLTLDAGRLRQTEGRVEEARRLYRQAATGFERQQDHASQGDSLLALAELDLLCGQYAEGIELGQRAMACWDEEDAQRRAASLCVIGQLEACQGNLSNAESTLKRARRLIMGHSYPLLAFRVLRVQAWVAYLQGAYHRAMGLNRLAEQEAGRDVSEDVVVSFRNPVPAILREWGEDEVAGAATRRRLEAAHQIQDRLALSHAYTDLGNLHLDCQQFAEAEDAFRQAIAEAEAAGEDGLHRLYGQVYLACTHFLRGDAAKAAKVAEAALRQSRARDAAPLELAIAQTAVALTHAGSRFDRSEDSRQMLDAAYQTFERLGADYGLFVSAALIGLAHLHATHVDDGKDHRRQARRYIAKALTLASAEGYAQTLVTARKITLPLALFALREGMEPRFVAGVLTRSGPESLTGIVEIAQDANPIVRERAVDALEAIGERDSCRETVITTLEQLAQDPDPKVRAAASQALHALDH